MSKNTFRFQDWQVYKDARRFRQRVKKEVNKFPKEERYSLSDQSNRALISILLNLAEGANNRTDKDTKVYVVRSLGSVNEVVACLDCAIDDNYITIDAYNELIQEAENLARQMNGFVSFLSKRVKD